MTRPNNDQADGIEGWREEMSSAYLYRRLAAREDGSRKSLFLELATAAERQAGLWSQKMAGTHALSPTFTPGLRTRIVGWLIQRFDPRAIKPILAATKVRGLSVYLGDVQGHAMPNHVDEVGGRHRGIAHGGNLRAAVFGVNDGLVSNTGLILGVVGAGSEPKIVLLSGVAGLLAGAFSMAAGEYISVRSQREMYEYQIGLEREEFALYPEEETVELALIYAARGVPEAEANRLAASMTSDPQRALDALAREELGLNIDHLGSPWGAAIASFLSFAGGAAIPLLPFLFGSGKLAWSIGLAGIALFAVGCALSLFTGRSAMISGLRMLLIGACAGIATYWIGSLLGVNLSG